MSGRRLFGQLHRLLAVGRLPDDVVAGVFEGPVQALADHGMVISDQNSNHQATFIRIRTTVPLSGPEVMSSWAPTESARSRMPRRP
jgi:hypothetical protein